MKFIRNHPYLFSIILIITIVSTISMLTILNIIHNTLNMLQNTYKFEIGKGNIGIIEINGSITQSNSIVNSLEKLRNAQNIKAVVIRINSPGGSVGSTQEIYREIKRLSLRKPVIASIGEIAASGGYYIASGTDCIFANSGSLIGSIGVIMNIHNLEQVMNKIGIKTTTIKNGKYKDIGSPTRPITDEEKKLLQSISNDIHIQFIEAVSHSRKIKKTELNKIADGRIFTGHNAKKIKLIDTIGNFNDSIQYAALKGGIKPHCIKTIFLENQNKFWKKFLKTSIKILVNTIINDTNIKFSF